MREFRTYGSVRGALRNERPYRDPYPPLTRILARLFIDAHNLFFDRLE